MEPEGRQWRLENYLIEEDEERLGWCLWANIHDQETLNVLWGRAWIEDEVLLMSAWKVLDASEFKNPEEVSQFLSTLPAWDKTPYFLKMGDLGTHRGLLDCKTFQPASEETQERIMPKLGFTRCYAPRGAGEP